MKPKRVLLLVNQSSGPGWTQASAEALQRCLRRRIGHDSVVAAALVENHVQVARTARLFALSSAAPSAVLSCGGGGTLRAVIEGVCGEQAPPPAHRLRVAPLRMGSGNLTSKALGYPGDPQAGLIAAIESLRAGTIVRTPLIRLTTTDSRGASKQSLGVALGGLGQFGRIPGILTRWHRRFPGLRRSAAALVGIERITKLEYAAAFGLRMLKCALFPGGAQEARIRSEGRSLQFRILAGTIQAFAIAGLPFGNGLEIDSPEVGVYLIPFDRRLSVLQSIAKPHRMIADALSLTLSSGRSISIEFTSGPPVEIFLDEDPLTDVRRLSLETTEPIALVPDPSFAGRVRRLQPAMHPRREIPC